MCCAVGMSTLPPRWPHFFSLASWSSQCTPAAPAAIMPFISSNALSGPPKPASASATMGANQSRSCLPPCPGSPRRPEDQAPVEYMAAVSIWSARSSALLMRRTTAGTEFAG
jgi:hypothetical protein